MRFSILVPEATVNYITNPGLRYDASGWTADGATITRSMAQARFGVTSLRVITNGVANNEGTFFRVSELSGISVSITVSAYVRGTGKVRIRLDNNVVGGGEFASQPVTLNPDRWTRISATGFSTGGNDLRLCVETAEGVPAARTFYVDGAQMEQKPYPTTYCDGDQAGCLWLGLAHTSSSSRSLLTRAGGRWVQLSGEEREADDLYMTTAGGLGVAPILNSFREFPHAVGGYLESSKIAERPISLVFHAKHNTDDDDPISLAFLHQLRELLVEVLNPDYPPGEQDVLFLYEDGGLEFIFQARYDGGLEGDWDIRNGFVNSFPLRLLSVSPLMTGDNQDVQILDFQDNSQTMRRVIGRVNGAWNNMNYGMNNAVGDLELGARGELVASGTFDSVNFNAAAVDPFRQTFKITYWDGVKWNLLAGSFTGSTINDAAIAPNGDIYATGSFTMIDGVAANYIARWNGTAWSALGSGLNLDGIHISIDTSGRVYVGGRFTTAGGLPASRVAFWDGSSWHGMGQYAGVNSNVNSIAISPDGARVYIAGNFVSQGGFALLHVALYDPIADRLTQVGQGFNGDVREVLLSSGGVLYACGDFTLSGSTTINRIGKFEGGAWLPLGSGMDNNVLSFDIGANGDIIAVGDFEHTGHLPVRNIALWNGSTWVNLDIEIAVGDTNLTLLAVQYNPNGDVYLGGGWTATFPSLFSGINVVTNQGSASVYPTVFIQGPGRLKWIENQTTGKRVFLDLDIISGEEVYLDFKNGRAFSSMRANLLGSILPGSDFHAFQLIPGENRIACFMTSDVNAVMQIGYVPNYWSADAVAESLL